MCKSIQVLTARYHRQDGLQQTFISHSWGGRKSKIEVLADSVPGESSSWLADSQLLAGSSHNRERESSGFFSLCLLIRMKIPCVMGVPGVMKFTSCKLHHLPKAPFPSSSHWWLGLQQRNFGETQAFHPSQRAMRKCMFSSTEWK